MTRKVKWTAEEDQALVQAIKANPHNKSEAFRQASARINRSFRCCSFRWYNTLSNPTSKYYVGCTFAMIGEASKLVNRVIVKEDSIILPSKSTKTLWAKIKKLLGIK